MRYSWCILVVALFAGGARAQLREIDSLQNNLRTINNSESRSDVMNRLSVLYYRISIPRSEQYARQALDLSNSVNYEKGIADALNNMGSCATLQGMHSEGLDYFFKALKWREKLRDRSGAAKTLNNISGIYLLQNDFDKAASYCDQSLNLVKKGDDPLKTGNALVSMALIYVAKKDTNTALSYYFQALDEYGQVKDKLHEVRTMIQIGVLEKDKEREQILAASIDALGKVNVASNFSVAIELEKTIAGIYAEMGKETPALQFYHKALKLADQYYDNAEQMKIRLEISALFEKQKKYDSSLLYYKAYAERNEKTYSSEKSSQLVVLGKVYETEKKDQELQINKEQIQSQGAAIVAISSVLVLITISGFVLYRYYRQKRQANVQLQQLITAVTTQAHELQGANAEIKRMNEDLEAEVNYRTEKIKLQNEKLIEYAYFNSHEVRGPIARILGLAALMKNDPQPEEVSDITQRILKATQELDLVVKEINKKLETE